MEFSLIEPAMISRLLLVTLLHFVWQATLICLAVVVIRAMIHPRHVQARYATSVFGLLTLVVATVATTGYYVLFDTSIASLYPAEDLSVGAASGSSESGTVWETLESQFLVVFGWFDSNRSLWLGFWIVGVLVLISRLVGSLIYCIQLRRSRIALPPHLERLASDIKSKLNLTRDIVVASSQRVTQAVATGIIKPVVLIPVSWVSELPLSAVEAVLAHELAHVKRWDLWVNLLQRLTETVFFFHPLVWWLSKTISSEREICCDQLAIRATGKPMKYVETLAQIARASTNDNLEIQLGTAFKGGKNMKLLRRARMILEPGSIDPGSPFRALTLVVCVAMLVSLGSYAYCSFPVPVQEDDDEMIQRIELLVDDIERQRDLDDVHESHRLHIELLHEEEVDRRTIARKLRELADQLESEDGHSLRARLHRDDKPHEHKLRIRARLHEDENVERHRYLHEDSDGRIERRRFLLQERDENVERRIYRLRTPDEDDAEEKKAHEYQLRWHKDSDDSDDHLKRRLRLHVEDENVELEAHPSHDGDLRIGRVYDGEVHRGIRLKEGELRDLRTTDLKVDHLVTGQLLLREANLELDKDLEPRRTRVIDGTLHAHGGTIVQDDHKVRGGLIVDGDRKIRRGTIVDGDRIVRGGVVVDRDLAPRRGGVVVDRARVRRGGGVVEEGAWHRVRGGQADDSDQGVKEALQDLKNQIEHLRHELHELKSKRSNNKVREAGRILRERIVDPEQSPLKLQYRLRSPEIEDQRLDLDLKIREPKDSKKIRVLSDIPQVRRLFDVSPERAVERSKAPEKLKTRIKLKERVIDPEAGERAIEGARLIELELKGPDADDSEPEEVKDIEIDVVGVQKSDK